MRDYKNTIVTGENPAAARMAAMEFIENCKTRGYPVAVVDYGYDRAHFGGKTDSLEIPAYLQQAGYQRLTFPNLKQAYFPLFDAGQAEVVRRLVMLLREQGQKGREVDAVRKYIKLLVHLACMEGQKLQNLEKIITHYSDPNIVHETIRQALWAGKISDPEAEHLKRWYTECVQAGPLLETLLEELQDDLFEYVKPPSPRRTIRRMADRHAYRFLMEINHERDAARKLSDLLTMDIAARCVDDQKPLGLLILDDGNVPKRWISRMADALGCYGCFLCITKDLFAGFAGKEDSSERDRLSALADEICFSRHPRMESARVISESLGQYWRMQKSSTVIHDRRLSQNRLLDRIFGTNRTDQSTETPYLDYRHTKEEIMTLDDRLYIVKNTRTGQIEMKVIV